MCVCWSAGLDVALWCLEIYIHIYLLYFFLIGEGVCVNIIKHSILCLNISACCVCSIHHSIPMLLFLCSCETSSSSTSSTVGISVPSYVSQRWICQGAQDYLQIFGMYFFVRRWPYERLATVGFIG